MLRPNLRRTLKPTLNRFMGGGGSPVVNVARLDGNSQLWDLEVRLFEPTQMQGVKLAIYVSDFENGTILNQGVDTQAIDFRVYFGDTGVLWLECGGSFTQLADLSGFGVSGLLLIDFVSGSECEVYLNGVFVTSAPFSVGVETYPAGTMTIFGRLGDGGNVEFANAGYCKDFSVDMSGSKVIEIPLTNKPQGATQLATVGSVNATMINYTPDVWEVENQPPQNTQQASFQQAKAGEESEVDDGGWSGSAPITYAYQWQLDGVDIVGATAKTLLVIAGMIGQSLRCVVTATNQYGSAVSITAAIVVTI